MTLTITFNKLAWFLPLMIVCHCHGVTDREIRASVECGARTCREVAEACGAGSSCGGCEPLVEEIVDGQRRLAVLRSEHCASPRTCSTHEAAAQQSA